MINRFHPVVTLLALSMAAAFPAAAQQPQPVPAAQSVAAVAAHPSAAAKLLEVKAQLTALQANVNATTAALNKMSKAARNEGDLAAAHKEFMAQYQALDAQMNAIRQMGTAARAGSDEYFKSWQAAVATIQNKDIRESAVERFNTAKERYARVLSMADRRQAEGPALPDRHEGHQHSAQHRHDAGCGEIGFGLDVAHQPQRRRDRRLDRRDQPQHRHHAGVAAEELSTSL